MNIYLFQFVEMNIILQNLLEENLRNNLERIFLRVHCKTYKNNKIVQNWDFGSVAAKSISGYFDKSCHLNALM